MVLSRPGSVPGVERAAGGGSTGSLGHVRRAASGFAPAADRDAPLVRLRVEFPGPGVRDVLELLSRELLGMVNPGARDS